MSSFTFNLKRALNCILFVSCKKVLGGPLLLLLVTWLAWLLFISESARIFLMFDWVIKTAQKRNKHEAEFPWHDGVNFKNNFMMESQAHAIKYDLSAVRKASRWFLESYTRRHAKWGISQMLRKKGWHSSPGKLCLVCIKFQHHKFHPLTVLFTWFGMKTKLMIHLIVGTSFYCLLSHSNYWSHVLKFKFLHFASSGMGIIFMQSKHGLIIRETWECKQMSSLWLAWNLSITNGHYSFHSCVSPWRYSNKIEFKRHKKISHS